MSKVSEISNPLLLRHFMEESQLLFELHKRTRNSLAVVFIDVDHFKRVNDSYGHGFGDEVLKLLAQMRGLPFPGIPG